MKDVGVSTSTGTGFSNIWWHLTLVVGLRQVLTFRYLLESGLVDFYGFSHEQDENPKVSGQRSG